MVKFDSWKQWHKAVLPCPLCSSRQAPPAQAAPFYMQQGRSRGGQATISPHAAANRCPTPCPLCVCVCWACRLAPIISQPHWVLSTLVICNTGVAALTACKPDSLLVLGWFQPATCGPAGQHTCAQLLSGATVAGASAGQQRAWKRLNLCVCSQLSNPHSSSERQQA